jgi:hypothetical protein
MLLLKDSSILYQGLSQEIFYALGVASALKFKLFGLNTVVTSLLDGQHNPGSLHPLGRAGDLRTLDLMANERLAWFNEVKLELEPMGFDVVWEGGVGATPETTGAHIHIEFDPKERQFWHQVGETS